jgi:hypothetical protein
MVRTSPASSIIPLALLTACIAFLPISLVAPTITTLTNDCSRLCHQKGVVGCWRNRLHQKFRQQWEYPDCALGGWWWWHFHRAEDFCCISSHSPPACSGLNRAVQRSHYFCWEARRPELDIARASFSSVCFPLCLAILSSSESKRHETIWVLKVCALVLSTSPVSC